MSGQEWPELCGFSNIHFGECGWEMEMVKGTPFTIYLLDG